MIVYQRVKPTQSWKQEVFGSLDYILLMCEMMDPYTSRSMSLSCAGYLKGKYKRQNHKGYNEYQMVGNNTK